MRILAFIAKVLFLIIALPLVWAFLGLLSVAKRNPDLFRIYRG